MPLTSAVKDLKNARALATEITDRGAKLYDLLGDEPDLRVDRSKALQFLEAISSNLSSTKEHQYIEQQLNELVQNVNDNVEQMTKQSAELDADESGLTGKIKKKQQDLDRNEKRLKSLKTVRPAFMDEYERLEKDLEVLYGTYLQKFRNLDYLEAELATLREVEKESMKVGERQMQRMQKRLREEELRIMRGEATANDSMDADAVPNARGKGVGASMNRNRPGSASKKDNYRGGNNRGGGRGNVHGNMGGGDLSDEESTGSEGLSDDSRSNSGSGSGSSDEVSLGSGAEDSDQMLSDSASGSEDLSDDVSGSGSSDNEF